MTLSFRIETLDEILNKDILPHVRQIIQDSVEEEVRRAITTANERMARALSGIAIASAQRIQVIMKDIGDRSGMTIEVVVKLRTPDGE